MAPKYFQLFTPEGKGIFAELDEHGIVTFAIEAGEGSSIRGTVLFQRMMQDFGADVHAIRGVWRKNLLGKPSTNIDKVNELTAQGIPLEAAVQSAWTATRAAKWGFQKVTVVSMEGRPGDYDKVDVLIEK